MIGALVQLIEADAEQRRQDDRRDTVAEHLKLPRRSSRGHDRRHVYPLDGLGKQRAKQWTPSATQSHAS
jgi:hypothetical protein